MQRTSCVVMSFVFSPSHCKHTVLLAWIGWVVKHGLSFTLKHQTLLKQLDNLKNSLDVTQKRFVCSGLLNAYSI